MSICNGSVSIDFYEAEIQSKGIKFLKFVNSWLLWAALQSKAAQIFVDSTGNNHWHKIKDSIVIIAILGIVLRGWFQIAQQLAKSNSMGHSE